MPRLPRRLVPRVVAAAVALLGAAVTTFGGLQATTLAPADEVRASLDAGDVPVVTSQVGVLDLAGPRVTVEARADGAPVFLGIGRAKDVESYLGSTERLEIAGHTPEGRLIADPAGDETDLPDPAGVDVWTVSTREQGVASLSWPDTPGQWRLVAATDGRAAAPGSVTFTWTVEESTSYAPALIAVGLLLLVGGGVTFAMLQSRSKLDHRPPPGPGTSPRREARQGVRL